MGYDGIYDTDMWEYNPSTNSWAIKNPLPAAGRFGASAFVIGNKAYIGTGFYISGSTNYNLKDFWEFYPDSNKWTQKSNFPGNGRSSASAFSIAGKGYLGLGDGTQVFSDFYQYNPVSDSWLQKSSFSVPLTRAAAFSINENGYVGTGSNDGSYPQKDVYEYSSLSDKWTRLPDFVGIERYGAIGFSVGGRGYIATGKNYSDYKNDMFEYWQ